MMREDGCFVDSVGRGLEFFKGGLSVGQLYSIGWNLRTPRSPTEFFDLHTRGLHVLSYLNLVHRRSHMKQ